VRRGIGIHRYESLSKVLNSLKPPCRMIRSWPYHFYISRVFGLDRSMPLCSESQVSVQLLELTISSPPRCQACRSLEARAAFYETRVLIVQRKIKPVRQRRDQPRFVALGRHFGDRDCLQVDQSRLNRLAQSGSRLPVESSLRTRGKRTLVPYCLCCNLGPNTFPSGSTTTKGIWCIGPLIASEKLYQPERHRVLAKFLSFQCPALDTVKVVMNSAAISAAFFLRRGLWSVTLVDSKTYSSVSPSRAAPR
jgi:hypothetical protein